ncbi:MAG: SpaH/EbpB family LPXTG-anchored major pilin [Eubacteriales bacterium]|nr:SpaH/EbpB family LPXTG-anchored major pilin [Eubacteriales bacterium]
MTKEREELQMKKRGLLKRIAALAMSAAMALGVVSVADAATIDETKKGSLQIQKYARPAEGQNPAEGIEGVEFKYVKVGDFALTGDADNKKVNGFTLDENLKDLLATLTPIETGGNVYDGNKIQEALKAALVDQRAAIEGLAENGKTLKTGNTGLSNKDGNLDLGLYLVVETDAPAEVVTAADPFVVSIPILETAENGTQSWKYDVLASPKNDTSDVTPSPDKTVTGTETEKINDDMSRDTASIGDVLTYTLHTNIIDNFGTLAELSFTDTMSKGLTLVDLNGDAIENLDNVSTGVFKVEGLAKNATKYTEITNNVSCTAVQNTDGTTALTITFENPDDNIKGTYTDIRVSYKAKINEHAVVGGNGNENNAKLVYGNNNATAQDITPVVVYTYGFTLQKNNENGAALAGATFKLYTTADGKDTVPFYTAIDTVTNQVEGEPVTEVTTAETTGKASFYGLAAGDYWLEETKAPSGYNLLKSRVKVTVSADTTADGVDITIVNTKGFTLPTTGGMGTAIFTIAGIVIMLGAAFMLIRANKKNKV